jgi:pimeloyl-ACP methyl ester carboxylesterase
VFAGYDELVRDAHFSTPPERTFSVLTDWLTAGAPAPSRAVATNRAKAPHTPCGQLTIGEIVEQPVVFGDRAALFGIRCAGPRLDLDRPAVLFLNTGSNHHVGNNRLWVTVARRLARQGFLSLRFDLGGIGDSPAGPGKPDNRLYSKDSCADVRAALDWLESEGHRCAVVVGLCSGAYIAFHTAIQDARIVGQVLINAQRFVWNEGDSLEIAMRKSFKSTRYYFERVRKPETWSRAISGGVNLAGIGLTLFERGIQRAGSSVSGVRGRVLGTESEKNEVVRGFYLLSDRGVETLLLYSAQDGGLDQLEAHLGRGARKLKGRTNVRIVLLEGADHTLTARWAQDRFGTQLEGFLGVRLKPDYAPCAGEP